MGPSGQSGGKGPKGAKVSDFLFALWDCYPCKIIVRERHLVMGFGTWLTKIQQCDWLVALV